MCLSDSDTNQEALSDIDQEDDTFLSEELESLEQSNTINFPNFLFKNYLYHNKKRWYYAQKLETSGIEFKRNTCT